MTVQEALEILHGETREDALYQYDREDRPYILARAERMAIEALEEIEQYKVLGTPKEIKIREVSARQLSEAYLSNLTELREYQSLGTVEELTNQKHNLSVAYKVIAELQQKDWIPCEEGLPSDTAIHEVTAQFSNGTFYTEFAYYDESREEWWKFDDDGTVDVVAWKEGSEPYKKEGAE